MSISELIKLSQLSSSVSSKGIIVEVGCLLGRSSWHIAANSKKDVCIICIDLWMHEHFPLLEINGKYVNYSIKEFENNLSQYKYKIFPIKAVSPDDFFNWHLDIDMLFEDSDHSNPGLKKNLDFWSSFVRCGGIISGHDYCDQFPDVILEVDAISKRYNSKLSVTDSLWSFIKGE